MTEPATWGLFIVMVCHAVNAPCQSTISTGAQFKTSNQCLTEGRRQVLSSIVFDTNGNPPPIEIICRGPDGAVVRESGPWSAM